MGSEELEFLTVYTRFIRHWRLLAAAAVVGGLLGWFFSLIQPPVYEAKTSIEVSIDFSQTGNISPYNFDHSVGLIQGVFYLKNVLTRVSSRAVDRYATKITEGFTRQFGMQRRGETWVLSVRNTDPEIAAFLVDSWREVGFEELSRSREHAMNARVLQRYLDTLESCTFPPIIFPPVPSICQDNITVDESAVKVIQDRIQQELTDSYAIQPYLIFSQNPSAIVSVDAVMYQTKWLVIGGMVAGLGIAVLFLQYFKLKDKTE